jgi:hypothetical protein
MSTSTSLSEEYGAWEYLLDSGVPRTLEAAQAVDRMAPEERLL